MSFFNFKGFGRNSKKNKHANNNLANAGSTTPMNTIYSSPHNSNSKLSLRKNHSPSRHSQHSLQQSQQQSSLYGSGNNYNNSSSSPERPESQQVMFLSEPFVRTALVKGSFKTIVQLPKYVDIGEWIALNVFEFFTNLNQFYGVIAEYVTPDAYPTMNAGPHTDYLWLDANNRQVSLPASQYIDLALTWIDNKVNDKNLFPTKNNMPFPQMFLRDVQRIMVQMFRIFAHIYHHHFDKIIHLSLEAHWNSFFAHFISFSKEFNIIDRKEMYPLLPLIENMEYQGKII
ncbi:maintenance of ploidy protein mob2 [Zygosaccharomyces mellis]|uniref:CBK1 kinase activator protein MOB2 n=1 Tax=Zygosaccharomyces mellis TaxID=42258 RepID=A0A4C2EBK1_9SACH|nr:maintenance of ploidy protein mob2 [Zygosaccharomyces mellis]